MKRYGIRNLLAWAVLLAVAVSAAELPPFAFVKRRCYGLMGTNATMFSRRVNCTGSEIVVCRDGKQSVIFRTEKGFVWDLSPSRDGTRIFFSYRELANESPFRVAVVNADGSGFRVLTSGPYHDFNPVEYPDGRIVFCSSRVESFSYCQDFLASALYIMDADGSNLRRFDFTTLCTSAPAVMPNGSILCTRWEYQDKNIFSWQGLWSILPDGRNLQLYYGNTLTVPNTRYGGRPVPGTDLIVMTMAAHHYPPIGDIALVDRKQGIENPAAMRKLTHETPYVPTKGRDWRDRNWGPGDKFFPRGACDPWPISKDLFFASIGSTNLPPDVHALCTVTVDGTKEQVPGIAPGAYSAVTLIPQPEPRAIIRTQVPTEAGTGVFYVQDVYRGLAEQGVARGTVKRLRIMRQLPKKYNTEGPRFHDHYPVIGYGNYYLREDLGEVPVYASGEAYFSAPSNCELYFIALDEAGREVQRMGSVTQITTGDSVSCVGCHEDRLSAPPPVSARSRHLGNPDVPRTPRGVQDYARDIQPIWDRHCIRCHSGTHPPTGVNLTDGKSLFFNQSYEQLVHRLEAVTAYFAYSAPTGVFPALKSGSMVSPLTELLESGHKGRVALSSGERRAVYAWIDANVPYYGTFEMTRPHLEGGRSPAQRMDSNGRRETLAWFASLTNTVAEHCSGCHEGLAFTVRNAPRKGFNPEWLNLTRPEESLMLTIHLPADSGGLGRVGEQAGKRFAFTGTNDAVYCEIRAALEGGGAELKRLPRCDMPGATFIPQIRDFGRIY